MPSANQHRPPAAPEPWSLTLAARGPDGTDRIAATIARHAGAGSVILLDGELAAGKTHFVKALVAALGSGNVVTSPTYALVHMYEGGRLRVIHVDAYRLKSPAEYDDLGLDDYRDEVLTVIEWGKLIGPRMPEALHIALAFVDRRPDDRLLTLSASGTPWRDLHATLAAGEAAILAAPTPATSPDPTAVPTPARAPDTAS